MDGAVDLAESADLDAQRVAVIDRAAVEEAGLADCASPSSVASRPGICQLDLGRLKLPPRRICTSPGLPSGWITCTLNEAVFGLRTTAAAL
jgi:hypothetical protein